MANTTFFSKGAKILLIITTNNSFEIFLFYAYPFCNNILKRNTLCVFRAQRIHFKQVSYPLVISHPSCDRFSPTFRPHMCNNRAKSQHCEFSGTAGSLPEAVAYSHKEVSTENDLWCGGQEAKDDRHIKRRLLNQREHEKWEDNVGDNLLRLNFMRPS